MIAPNRRDLVFGAAALCIIPGAAHSAPRLHRIFIQAMRFGPVPAGIRAGDTILWVNRDVVPHTATARDRSFDVTLAANSSARMTARRTGTFAVYCRYHPTMTARLAVAR